MEINGSRNIYYLIGKAHLGQELTADEQDWLLRVARGLCPDMGVDDQTVRTVFPSTFPAIWETARRTRWNVKVPVVEIVQARTRKEAVSSLIEAIDRADFPTDYASDSRCDAEREAFVSDDDTGLGIVQAALSRDGEAL